MIYILKTLFAILVLFATTFSENANFIFFADICYDSKARSCESLPQEVIRYYGWKERMGSSYYE